jgi:hypothetical protein
VGSVSSDKVYAKEKFQMSIPIFELLFALALALLPLGVKSFTVKTDELREPVMWTLQSDGWHAKMASGGEAGLFTIEGATVTKVFNGETSTQSVDEFFKVETGADQSKKLLVEGKPAEMEWSKNKVILKDPDNAKNPPIVIEFSDPE